MTIESWGRHLSPAAGGAGAARLSGFEKIAFMRHEYPFPHPEVVRPGNPQTSLVVFANLTNSTQDLFVGSTPYSVPRWKSRCVETAPRQTDIWLKGGERKSYDLEAGVAYRIDIVDAFEDASAPTPPEHTRIKMKIINRGNSARNLFVNGDKWSPVHVGVGQTGEISVPGGEFVLSCHIEDRPDACFLVVRPQKDFAFDMF
ncbi:MAG: hypothetical protein HRF49_07915 [bacterium]